ncbi:MAG: glycosyltransferase [Cyanobacteria bacterium RM1_2_2]|nr:glycosyltransferase [Cyanobacteria bacterium RM1_2_2]
METPILSIVTPTRGNFSDDWFSQLLAVQGQVQFVLVYPPGAVVKPVSDPRVKTVVSPAKGEVMQRLTGLLNASGQYVMALDDDDFVHPDAMQVIAEYFERFPDSWVLRLAMEKLDFEAQDQIRRPWTALPTVNPLTVADRRSASDLTVLQTIPIAPLQNPFDWRYLVSPLLDRRDMHGPHIENFNNKVWRNDYVQPALADLSNTMRLVGALSWMPFWSLDRLLGLFIQARYFEPGKIVGHWMPAPAQIRYVVMPQELKREFRLILPADALLVKRFPQYGYFWNLFCDQFWAAARRILRS